jgi:hypothetical protein
MALMLLEMPTAAMGVNAGRQACLTAVEQDVPRRTSSKMSVSNNESSTTCAIVQCNSVVA